MKDSIAQILDDADRLLECNRFAEARDRFRIAVTRVSPNSRTRINWLIAEAEEQLMFMREVVETHPDNVGCHLCLACELLRQGKDSQSLLTCNRLLETAIGSQDELLIRLTRLDAAAQCGRFETFPEDFGFVWYSELGGARRFRKRLLKMVANLSDVTAVSCVEEILRRQNLPTDVQAFLDAKQVELQALQLAEGQTRA